MTIVTIDRAESVRLHEDWWGKCRTCRFWNGATAIREGADGSRLVHLRWDDAECENPRSLLVGQVTTTEGHCRQWDSFDVDVALETM